MKKILFSALLLFAANSNAQLGVTTIRPRKPVPIGQWYNVSAKWGNNRIFFYDLKANVDTLLNELLLPWNLSIANGESDEDGDLSWFLDNLNGYSTTIYRIDEGDYVQLQFISAPYESPISPATPKNN